MFNSLQPMPLDPILGLMTAFGQDTNPNKIDLGVGIYKTEQGETPVLSAVKKAEAQRLAHESTKKYIGMAGSEGFNTLMQSLILGEHKVQDQQRARTVQTPGGTGALRVAAEFIKRCKPDATVWLTTPTWANHIGLFSAAGLSLKEFPYYDYDNKGLLFKEMMESLSQAGKGDVVLLHACCHNPSGMDLNKEQWQAVADLALEKGFTPLIDTAYLGFGEGLEQDAYGIRLLAEQLPELMISSSCSKNFGLYRERIGAFTLIADNSKAADIAHSVVLNVVRSIYSMPPAHGGVIVETILGSTELTALWHQELDEMRNRINGLRSLLVSKLAEKGAPGDFSFIENQFGMFSFLGISPEQVEQLKKDYSIYMVGSSRMNVAGISQSNIDYFAESVSSVLKG